MKTPKITNNLTLNDIVCAKTVKSKN